MWNDWHIIMFRNTKWLSSTFTCFLINRLNILMHLKNNYEPRCTNFEGQGKGKGELLKTTWEIQIERVKSRFPFFTFATKINKWKKKAISQPKKKEKKKEYIVINNTHKAASSSCHLSDSRHLHRRLSSVVQLHILSCLRTSFVLTRVESSLLGNLVKRAEWEREENKWQSS